MSNENNANSSGWDAIEAEFLRVYPGQTEPKHYGTLIKWWLGGNDPLDGISIYDGGDYWHFVTFGLSDLYEKETEDPEWSGYGFELTLKLKKYDFEDLEGELQCICGILQSIELHLIPVLSLAQMNLSALIRQLVLILISSQRLTDFSVLQILR